MRCATLFTTDRERPDPYDAKAHTLYGAKLARDTQVHVARGFGLLLGPGSLFRWCPGGDVVCSVQGDTTDECVKLASSISGVDCETLRTGGAQ